MTKVRTGKTVPNGKPGLPLRLPSTSHLDLIFYLSYPFYMIFLMAADLPDDPYGVGTLGSLFIPFKSFALF